MTFEDFDVVVSSTTTRISDERLEKLEENFRQAGILNYRIDREDIPVGTPLRELSPAHWGVASHFARILRLQK